MSGKSNDISVKPRINAHAIKHNNKDYTISELSEMSNICGKKLYYRLKKNKFILTPDMLSNERIDLAYKDGVKPASDCGKKKGDIVTYNVLGEDISINTIEAKYSVLPNKFKKNLADGLTINQIVFGAFGDVNLGLSMLDAWKIVLSGLPCRGIKVNNRPM